MVRVKRKESKKCQSSCWEEVALWRAIKAELSLSKYFGWMNSLEPVRTKKIESISSKNLSRFERGKRCKRNHAACSFEGGTAGDQRANLGPSKAEHEHEICWIVSHIPTTQNLHGRDDRLLSDLALVQENLSWEMKKRLDNGRLTYGSSEEADLMHK